MKILGELQYKILEVLSDGEWHTEGEVWAKTWASNTQLKHSLQSLQNKGYIIIKNNKLKITLRGLSMYKRNKLIQEKLLGD